MCIIRTALGSVHRLPLLLAEAVIGLTFISSMFCHCWLGDRQGIQSGLSEMTPSRHPIYSVEYLTLHYLMGKAC